MIEVRFDTRAFAEWLRRFSEQLQVDAKQALGQSTALALAEARRTTLFRDRTGALRGSLERGWSGPWQTFLRASAPHAKFVEDGTKPHRIEARNRKALRFVQSGEVRFRRSVWHPGTKPTHFLRKASEVGEAALARLLESAVQRAAR